ncbi:hypothetical protein AB5N19_00318 [Seiridium cardinale]
MSALHLGAATLPKGFRRECDMPRTPEPIDDGNERLASPPRPRFRLKKRNASSHLRAPTQQFLASVAAADVPLPSVEEPDFATADQDMADIFPDIHLPDDDGLDIYQRLRTRAFSPPKTPAIDLPQSLSATKFPDWSIDSSWSDSDLDSSPEYESSRPSTAFSTQTSSSLFSQFSHASEEGDDCISPDVDKGAFVLPDLRNVNEDVSNRKPRKAPWTKAMSSHLWSTYMLYLQDSRVTPINMGKSCIPPNGVCARVAREAKRSWKGSKPTPAVAKSGSSTPTAESSKPYMEWPHTCAATRAHLRELCKLKAAPKHGPTPHMSRSPAPFNMAAHRRWNRRSTPARSPSVFSAQDIAMSLTLSTSETMQPTGPLALLTSSPPEPPTELLSNNQFSGMPSGHVLSDKLSSGNPFIDHAAEASRMRLGSPFLAKSYGPSSSSSLAENIEPWRQSQTVGPRKLLKSPARLTRSRSGTQKRRSVKGLEDQPRKRPSLATALWGPSANTADPFREATNNIQFSSTNSCESDKLFIPRTAAADPFTPSGALAQATSLFANVNASHLASATTPARLGSPFSTSQTSHSFPNRLSQPTNFNLAGLRRPFATVQQTAESGSETSPTRSSLSSRLAYIDQRLKELRNRSSRRRSQSPPA